MKTASGAPTVAVWFRKGLRLHDNAALLSAAASGARVLPFFVLDLGNFQTSRFSVERFNFLLGCLKDLDDQLKGKFGSILVVFRSSNLSAAGGKGSMPAEKIIECLCKDSGLNLTKVCFEYDSSPFARARDEKATEICKKHGVVAECHAAGHTLLDVEKLVAGVGKGPAFKPPTTMASIQKILQQATGSKSVDNLDCVPQPKPAPAKLGKLPDTFSKSSGKGAAFGDWQAGPPSIAELYPGEKPHPLCVQQFPPGETEALKRLARLVEAAGQREYVTTFQKPKTSSTNVERPKGDWTTPSTTGLGAYVAMGALSPRRLWWAVQKQIAARGGNTHSKPPSSLLGQLLFREQFYLLSRAVPNFDKPSGNPMCKDIQWAGGGRNGTKLETPDAKAKLLAWQQGRTGYPLIDALMRQLNATGWMHHLGRHACACFLTRGDLYLNWTHGRDYFEKRLLDGDWALNNGNWLWLAGVAPFSSPWFRVYSPVPSKESALNAEMTGAFVKFWVPELRSVPTRFIYAPHEMPQLAQTAVKFSIGKDYPQPVVEHKTQSKKNLDAFKKSLDELAASGGTSRKRPASPFRGASPGKKAK